MSFIYRNLMRSPPLRTYLNLAFFYNRIHMRMTNLEEVYNLIMRNIKLTMNLNIIEQISL